MNWVKTLIPLALIGLLVGGGIYLFTGNGLDNAISEYEDHDYIAAIKKLNALLPSLEYDKAEKAYYYRCRSINRLAEELEKDYREEITEIVGPTVEPERRKKLVRKIADKIISINNKIRGDLVLHLEKGRGSIVSRGRFYTEFISRYNGSKLIEDLDFEEVSKTGRVNRGHLLNAIANFYSRYPNTAYLAQLVKIIFNNLNTGDVVLKGKEDFLRELLLQFVRKYPTSSEYHRIFSSNADNVNLRNTPGTEGSVVGKIAEDELLIQLEKTMDTFQVGDKRDYWYRVASLRGVRGWIFGKFLQQIDVSKLTETTYEQKWTFEDNFGEWKDSYTPANWMHLEQADRSTISFTRTETSRTVNLAAAKGRRSGLYRRLVSPHAFSILLRARFIAGAPLTLISYVLSDGKSFSITLGLEELEIAGRRIPFSTGDWHEYLLETDGKNNAMARLLIDGEVITSRIPSVVGQQFANAGLYLLVSPGTADSSAAVEYIKIRN